MAYNCSENTRIPPWYFACSVVSLLENYYETTSAERSILVPKGRALFGQHQESRPLARSNDIPVLIETRTNQICQTWLWACAEWRQVRELRTYGFRPSQRPRFLVLTKRSAASGDENAERLRMPVFFCFFFFGQFSSEPSLNWRTNQLHIIYLSSLLILLRLTEQVSDQLLISLNSICRFSLRQVMRIKEIVKRDFALIH